MKEHVKMIELDHILQNHANWWYKKEKDNGAANEKARGVLSVFYKALLHQKPVQYFADRWGHFSYLFHYIKIRQALDEENYPRACNEIQSLIHYYPFYQPGIYYNLLRILEPYGKEGDYGNVVAEEKNHEASGASDSTQL